MTEPNFFSGLRVRLDVNLTEPGEPYQARRSWRVRLCSRPWRPWVATITIVPQVPMKGGIQFQNTLIMHPATWQALKHAIEPPPPSEAG